MAIPTFDEYLANLGRLSEHVDPAAFTDEAVAIVSAARALQQAAPLNATTLTDWVRHNPSAVPVLGLVVGLSQERLKGALKQHLGTAGWVTAARERPDAVVSMLDAEFGLVHSLNTQISRTYEFGDVLVARAGSRAAAVSASNAGRLLEDRIEAIAAELGLGYETRTRFDGRWGRSAPCDLAIPTGGAGAQIVVAAKAFDSTGSKLTDAVREVQEMAEVRRGNQTVMAAVDGIGWLSRASDLRRLHTLWANGEIDGMYTMSMLDLFREDLARAARYKGLI